MLALPLLVARVGADYPYHPAASYYLATLAHWFDARTYLHNSLLLKS
jgi:hypothetical protein